MKTAMQELIEELKQAKELEANPFINTTIGLILNIAESKLEKEKQQIIDAYQGFDHDMTAEDYFSETFF